jgi:hypothetical protein
VIAAGCGGSSKKATTTEATTTEATTTQAGTEGLSLSGKCTALKAIALNVQKALASGGTSGTSTGKDLEALAGQAPAEIKPDFEVIAQFYSEFLKIGLQAGKVPTPEQQAELAKLGSAANQKKIQAAGQHIQAWVQKNCT